MKEKNHSNSRDEDNDIKKEVGGEGKRGEEEQLHQQSDEIFRQKYRQTDEVRPWCQHCDIDDSRLGLPTLRHS